MSTLQPSDARGAVGGIEVLPFALLLAVGTALVFASAWGVVTAKLATEQAATAAGRAYASEVDPITASARARWAARASFEGSGRDPERLRLRATAPGFVRCAAVEHRTATDVASLRVPLIGGLGPPITVHGRHRTVLDRFASDLPGEADCG